MCKNKVHMLRDGPLVQAVREQSEELRALQFAVNEAKAAIQREQQEHDHQLLQVRKQHMATEPASPAVSCTI